LFRTTVAMLSGCDDLSRDELNRGVESIAAKVTEGDDDPLGVDDLTTHRRPLDRAPEAYSMFQKKEDGAIKVVLKP
jgi:threonine dehydrogenase-like Zn-dependent dehydrogenase